MPTDAVRMCDQFFAITPVLHWLLAPGGGSPCEAALLNFALAGFIGDVLLGLLPVLFLYYALKATFPFRWYAVLWYLGVVAGAFMVVYGDVPALQSAWTNHSTLKALGYLAGAIWWVRPRPKPERVFE